MESEKAVYFIASVWTKLYNINKINRRRAYL